MSSSMIRVANRPNVDTQGFVNGVLKKVILGEGMRREKKGRNIDETKYDRYEFYFEVEGKSGDPIEIRLVDRFKIDETLHVRREYLKHDAALHRRIHHIGDTTTLAFGI